MRFPLVCMMLTLAVTAAGAEPLTALHRIILEPTATYQIVSSSHSFDVFPLSQRLHDALQQGNGRAVQAADFATAITLRTKDPTRAVQEIVQQIAKSTQRRLGVFRNSGTPTIAPAVMVMASDSNSVWFVVLTPAKDAPDTFALAVAYFIDDPAPPGGEKPEQPEVKP